ncbi:rRNA maturation RNase YbeY [Fonticella tunisiensis]|uniref:Endoribonuclease YbeY n=1 Tax=Fonticella tunisiensis TaxID=1096341 RepID=A0A4R7KDS8_9CLOT|nr:rRNA maturation RNase YbeY [Fonticella tunisiensis]TDT51095.1 putative rRNA maturation factor [Fonticella tunisiensis]
MIEFDNRQTRIDFSKELESLIEKSVEAVLALENFNKEYELSVVLTDDAGIKEINREFRNIDKATDVLSFPMLDFEEGYYDEEDMDIEDLNPDSGAVVLGDMVISLERAKSQSEEYGHTFEREVAYLTVHSILHLLGYDHEREEDRLIMRSKEEEILGRLGISR